MLISPFRTVIGTTISYDKVIAREHCEIYDKINGYFARWNAVNGTGNSMKWKVRIDTHRIFGRYANLPKNQYESKQVNGFIGEGIILLSEDVCIRMISSGDTVCKATHRFQNNITNQNSIIVLSACGLFRFVSHKSHCIAFKVEECNQYIYGSQLPIAPFFMGFYKLKSNFMWTKFSG